MYCLPMGSLAGISERGEGRADAACGRNEEVAEGQQGLGHGGV